MNTPTLVHALPRGHGVHSVWFPVLKVPAGHANADDAVVVSGQANPAGQTVHAESPAGDDEPGLHGTSKRSATLGQAKPAGHRVHSRAPASEYDDAGSQGVTASVVGHAAPAGQSVQLAALPSLKKPGAHGVGATMSVVAQAWPAGHARHAVRPPGA